jgi:hypothetical protein
MDERVKFMSRSLIFGAPQAGRASNLVGMSAHPVLLIDTPAEHGLPGLVHLFGIESPGLIGAMSLAEEVVASLAL